MGVVKGQDHTVRPVSNWFAFFSFHINQITIPQYSYFEIWPWQIKGQGHGWGQRSRSHSSPSIQSMYLLFISHQSDQPFLRYVQKSVWPWKNTSEILEENLLKTELITEFLQNLIRWWPWPEEYSYQVVIGWVVITLSCRQANFC